MIDHAARMLREKTARVLAVRGMNDPRGMAAAYAAAGGTLAGASRLGREPWKRRGGLVAAMADTEAMIAALSTKPRSGT